MEKGGEFQKNIYFCFIDYVKAFDCVDPLKQLELKTLTRAEEMMLLNCGVGENSRESLGRQGDPTSPS